MPFREDQTSAGFNRYDRPEVIPPAPQPNFIQGLGDTLQIITAPINPAGAYAAYQRQSEVWNAAFRMENDVVNAFQLFNRPAFKADPAFDLKAQLQADGLWDLHRNSFLGVESADEYRFVQSKIAQEDKDRATLSAAGFPGLVAQVAAGMVSPTILLPFVGEARGWAALGRGLMMGFVGGAAQELPLQLNQETRTMQESLFSVGMSTVVGGVLGGAVGYLSRPLDDVARDTALSLGEEAIPEARVRTTAPRPASAGAAALREEAGGLKSTIPGVDAAVDVATKISPVTRVLESSFKQAQWMMAQLSTAGLTLEKNAKGVASAIGGSVEQRVKPYYAPVANNVVKLDDAYARYLYSASEVTAVQRQTAKFQGLKGTPEKMSKREFSRQVSLAMTSGDKSPIPEVQEVADSIRREVYEPTGEKALAVGIYKELGDTPGDVSYLNRVYDTSAIEANPQAFSSILAEHYNQKLSDQYSKQYEKLLDRQLRDQTLLEDLNRGPEEVAQLREKFANELKALDEGRSGDLADLEDEILDKRSAARDKTLNAEDRKALLEAARTLEERGGVPLAELKAQRAEARRRLRNLNRSVVVYTQKQQAKLDRITAIEDSSLRTLNRLVKRGQRDLNKLDSLTDEAFLEEARKWQNRFTTEAAKLDRLEKQINKLDEDAFYAGQEGTVAPDVEAARTRAFQSTVRLNEITARLEEAEALDPTEIRNLIQEGLDEQISIANALNMRRAQRAARLEEAAAKLDPELVKTKMEQLRQDIPARRLDFFEGWRERGAHIDGTGKADFSQFAQEAANTTMHHILGTHMRLPGMDIIMKPRGPELARVLDIPSSMIADFLETDIEKLMMMYTRTMAPDIELAAKFGEFAPDMGRNPEFLKLQEEYDARVKFYDQEMAAGRDPVTHRKRTFTPEQMDKKRKELAKEYADVRRDLEAVIGRLRHTWGVPPNPQGFAARAAKIALNLNVLRLMGGVTVSSIPDIAQPILKYGLLHTFKSSYLPMIKGLGVMQATKRELQLAGVALDTVLHSRAMQLYDIGDYMVRGTPFEKALEFGTSKMGILAAFDYWTVAMKQVAGAASNARLMDALSIVAGGEKAGAREIEKATEFLAANGINADLANEIWRQTLRPGGGAKINGVWLPNTEAWDNAGGAVDAYRAALAREVDSTIITPGVERPLWMDSSLTGRLLGQFKSFGMSSTFMTTMASLQRRDMAAVTGSMISLALGTLSYYIYANLAGGKAKEDMDKAIATGNWGKFADEAIARSGLIGVGGDVQSILSEIPGAAPFVTFTGDRVTRRGGGSGLVDALAGPSADLANSIANVISGAHDPTKSTLHQLRKALPLQNHFLLRQALDKIEAAAPIKESRQ